MTSQSRSPESFARVIYKFLELKRLQDKCMDLENRSCRGKKHVSVLGEENFTSPVIIDWAHLTVCHERP